MSDPSKQLQSAYAAIFFVAGMSIVIGLLSEIAEIQFLKQLGYGWSAILSGIVFAVLGFLVKRGSMIALGIAVALYVIDGVIFFVEIAKHGGTPPIGGIIFRIFLLSLMVKGFSAISGDKQVSLPPGHPAGPRPFSMPGPSQATKLVSTPGSISFVAPSASPPMSVAPSAPHPVDPVEVERQRLDLSRHTQARPQKVPAIGPSVFPKKTELRAKPVAAFSAASALRFVAYKCEVSLRGLRTTYSNGTMREIYWQDIASLVLRQLPPDPPWEGKLLLDLVPSVRPGESLTPIRVFPTTYVNYATLPQGQSTSTRENMRRLASFVASQNSDIAMDPATSMFLQGGNVPPRFINMNQFAEYDSRYSAPSS